MADSSQKKPIPVQTQLDKESVEGVKIPAGRRRPDYTTEKRVADADIAKSLLGRDGAVSLQNEALKGLVEANADRASLRELL